jgi:hypothetical protein
MDGFSAGFLNLAIHGILDPELPNGALFADDEP